jgi:hypothetical protein
MKILFAGALFAAGFAILPCGAQSAHSQTAKPPTQGAPQMPGQVVFSRSHGQGGQATTAAGKQVESHAQTAAVPTATDAERQAVRLTAYEMDVHLDTAARHIAVRARVDVRNDGTAPLQHLPLQISSTLAWDGIRADGHDVAYTVAAVNSDADHSGQLREAEISLAEPLAAGHSMHLDVTYSGELAPDATRLTAIGAPADQAFRSDWDGIGVDFTGLRGFGNVVWYPVASVPASLGEGAKLYDEIGRQKLRLEGASFQLRLTVEFPHGKAPTVAVIDGHAVPLNVANSGSTELPGVATASLENVTLGFGAPSLFVAVRNHHAVSENMDLWTLPEDDSAAFSWKAADTEVTPFLQSWLGEKPLGAVTVLDLPAPDDAPFQEGALLVTGVKAAAAADIDPILARALTHAYTQSPRAWLGDGLADFMGTLWAERTGGREKALATLEASRQALALIEPASPGVSAGQPLNEAYVPVYYRTKAEYVLWMLRDLVGGPALARGLRAYDAARSTVNVTSAAPSLETCLEKAANGRDLSWFFAQWVNADNGLPDLSIEHVYPSPAEGGNWLVAVDLSNSGYAAAEVPLTVRSGSTSVTRRVLIPAQGKSVKRILIQGQPTQVQLNDGSVPEVEASVHVTSLHSTSAENVPAELR